MTAFSGHRDLAYSTVLTAPAPALSGTTLTLTAGGGALMPSTLPFYVTVAPANTLPIPSVAEVVLVTNLVGDVATVTRAQGGTTAKAIAVGWQFFNGVASGWGDEVEAAINADETALANHIADPTGAHAASAISAVDAGGYFTGTDIEAITQELGADVGSIPDLSVILAPAASARNVIQPTAGAVIAAVIKAHAAQSVDLTQWQNSAGTVLARMTFDGQLQLKQVVSPGSVVPIPFANKTGFDLEDDGATDRLYFSLINTAGGSAYSLFDNAVVGGDGLPWYYSSAGDGFAFSNTLFLLSQSSGLTPQPGGRFSIFGGDGATYGAGQGASISSLASFWAKMKAWGWFDAASTAPAGLPPSGAAGGVLSGTYPNPGFAVDMATQAELDAVLAAAVILAPASSARNVIQPTAGTVIAAIVKAHAAQSVDLFRVEAAAGTGLGYLRVGATGAVGIGNGTYDPAAYGGYTTGMVHSRGTTWDAGGGPPFTPGASESVVGAFHDYSFDPSADQYTPWAAESMGLRVNARAIGVNASADLRALDFLADLRSSGGGSQLHTLVGISGSAYQGPGTPGSIDEVMGASVYGYSRGTGTYGMVIGARAVALLANGTVGSYAAGLQGEVQIWTAAGAVAIPDVSALKAVVSFVDAGPVTLMKGLDVPNMGAAQVVTSYGAYIAAQSGSTNVYGLYVAGGDNMLVAGAPTETPLTIRGAAAQADSLLVVEDSALADLFKIGPTGAVTIEPNANGAVPLTLVPNTAADPSLIIGAVTGYGTIYAAAGAGGVFITDPVNAVIGSAGDGIYWETQGVAGDGLASFYVGDAYKIFANATGIGFFEANPVAQQLNIDTIAALWTALKNYGLLDATSDAPTVYSPGGTDVALADGGTGASLTDPNADRIMFWDDSAGAMTWLTPGTGLTVTGTTIDASASGDSSTDNLFLTRYVCKR